MATTSLRSAGNFLLGWRRCFRFFSAGVSLVRMMPATTQQHVQGQRGCDEIGNERAHESFPVSGLGHHLLYRPGGQDCLSNRAEFSLLAIVAVFAASVGRT